MTLDPQRLSSVDLEYECRLRGISNKRPEKERVKLIKDAWENEETHKKRPMDPPEIGFRTESLQIDRRIYDVERAMSHGKDIDLTRVWTKLYQATWSLYRFEVTEAHGRDRKEFLQFENRLSKIYSQLRGRIDLKHRLFRRAYQRVKRAPEVREYKLMKKLQQQKDSEPKKLRKTNARAATRRGKHGN